MTKPQANKSSALAKQQDAGLPAGYDFDADAGAGLEGMSADEQVVPFLRILQANSPTVQESTVPGAKAGLIINTATSTLMPGFDFVIVHRDHKYIKRIPFDQGGGFLGILEPDNEEVLKLRQAQGQFGTLKCDDGESELAETRYWYVFAKAHGLNAPAFRAMVPLASTQIGKYKAVMTKINTELLYPGRTAGDPPRRPALWAHRWKATTRLEQNKKGKFFGWVFDLDTDPERAAKAAENGWPMHSAALLAQTDPLYIEAKAFYTTIQEGKAKVDYSKTADAAEGDAPF